MADNHLGAIVVYNTLMANSVQSCHESLWAHHVGPPCHILPCPRFPCQISGGFGSVEGNALIAAAESGIEEEFAAALEAARRLAHEAKVKWARVAELRCSILAVLSHLWELLERGWRG